MLEKKAKLNESLLYIFFRKCLYSVCEQLTDSDVHYYKEKLFPGVAMNITCAEELLCQAFMKNIFHENDLRKLKEVFKDRSDCLKLISLYTGTAIF